MGESVIVVVRVPDAVKELDSVKDDEAVLLNVPDFEVESVLDSVDDPDSLPLSETVFEPDDERVPVGVREIVPDKLADLVWVTVSEVLLLRDSDGMEEDSDAETVTVRDIVGTEAERVVEPLKDPDSVSTSECVSVRMGVTDIVGKEFVGLSGSEAVALELFVPEKVGERVWVPVDDREPDSVMKLDETVEEVEPVPVSEVESVLVVVLDNVKEAE